MGDRVLRLDLVACCRLHFDRIPVGRTTSAASKSVYLDMNGWGFVAGSSVTRNMHAYMFARHRRRYVLRYVAP